MSTIYRSEKKERSLCSESKEQNGVGLMNLGENYSKKVGGGELRKIEIWNILKILE